MEGNVAPPSLRWSKKWNCGYPSVASKNGFEVMIEPGDLIKRGVVGNVSLCFDMQIDRAASRRIYIFGELGRNYGEGVADLTAITSAI